MRKATVLIAAMALALLPATGALGQTAEGEVIVVHGVPDLTVDIYVNGDLTLEGFEYGETAGPLALPEGSYDLEVYAAGADPESEDPALAGSTDLPAGAVATIAAYLEEGGSATLGVFVENNETIDAGNARVTARHLADFGAVDILANGDAVFSGVTNGQGGDADVPADTYNIQITAAGDPDTVAFDQDVPLSEGTNTIAYAVGSVEAGNFQVVTAAIEGLESVPDGVPTGNAGLAASSSLLTVVALGGLALIAITGGSMVLARKDR